DVITEGGEPPSSPPCACSSQSWHKHLSSQYKGVVPQPNGQWGAQIYEKHQCVWLGTFNEEVQATCAYYVTTQCFHSCDAITNFKPLFDVDKDGASELLFLSSHSKLEIVNMLYKQDRESREIANHVCKQTYYDELQQSCRALDPSFACAPSSASALRRRDLLCHGSSPSTWEQLFDKAVTPSGNTPKSTSACRLCAATYKGVLINFEDPCSKGWSFCYSYENISCIVKEESLQAGGIVSLDSLTGPYKQLYIKESSVPEGEIPLPPPSGATSYLTLSLSSSHARVPHGESATDSVSSLSHTNTGVGGGEPCQVGEGGRGLYEKNTF
ncbi:hypothetical protein Taro_019305, partial [Colocasia esculenta]|nr:hypothetical protein [Colocasia esculenta]